ncbi:alkaline phosphatase family protein [Oceanospirillum sediminis]|uniref:Alkaline phosphatase family protein n=1 Tax=Oceanospirillum sediminis TaxID=2760088 RepID=A0A839IRY9_9GAMM|nr:alkaline phosphatase family protein [Oceanospirillum sediminis]MBB1486966.1 alkaline phosphatase family protein [Oceanospirillum sediminis]
MPDSSLPLVLAGPILRRLTPERLTFWLATTSTVQLRLTLLPENGSARFIDQPVLTDACRVLKAGEKLFFYMIDLPLSQPLPQDCWIGYQLELMDESQSNQEWMNWRHWAPDLCYPGKDTPGFVLRSALDKLLHGSCRKPHHDSGDGLVRADEHLAERLQQPDQWPALLMMSGDQIYADDVAGPMLNAIHQLLNKLELPVETLPDAELEDTNQLHQTRPSYYERENLLPLSRPGKDVRKKMFEGVRKPVFTTDTAHNHLVSLGEVLGMYLLVWSPAGWECMDTAERGDMPEIPGLNDSIKERFYQEHRAIKAFVGHLGQVRRVMAHLPVAMMFDDHDITDDWNLTAGWEQTAYEHLFSRRIIGNALLGYLICQGWGNSPEQYPEKLMTQVQQSLSAPGSSLHDLAITELYRFGHWHYQWDTQPVLMVLDTRTHRWRSEKSVNKPSGLMDWEALTDLQHRLMGLDAVVLVSPAPVFGVKLIEAVQKIFTWCGKPLMVDAENWMAHSGAAYGMMNIFRHVNTPKHFVILSGDVHYSFVYDVELRGDKRDQDIWQITSSGLKNEFPDKLLTSFDRLNRWLYSPVSPLNWFTKRRKMRIIPRKPDSADPGERLLNAAGIGLVELTADGQPERVVQLCADGRTLEFHPREHEAHWN